MHRFIATIAPQFLDSAMQEINRVDGSAKARLFCADFGVLVETERDNFLSDIREFDPIFVRHIMPADNLIQVTGRREEDLPNIQKEAEKITDVSKGQEFAVQCRSIGKNYDYNAKDVEVALGRRLEALGGIPKFKRNRASIRKILFVFIFGKRCYLGFCSEDLALNSECDEYRMFSREKANFSRAEFKLLEAIEKFGIETKGRAVDIGAAPGGWTYVLASRGMEVVAVDPAVLDEEVTKMKNVKHVKSRFNPSLLEGSFDLAVNDMNIEGLDSAKLMNMVAKSLKPGAYAIMTLKITTKKLTAPNVSRKLEKAIMELSQSYDLVTAKSLFHNRREVTLLLRSK